MSRSALSVATAMLSNHNVLPPKRSSCPEHASAVTASHHWRRARHALQVWDRETEPPEHFSAPRTTRVGGASGVQDGRPRQLGPGQSCAEGLPAAAGFCLTAGPLQFFNRPGLKPGQGPALSGGGGEGLEVMRWQGCTQGLGSGLLPPPFSHTKSPWLLTVNK